MRVYPKLVPFLIATTIAGWAKKRVLLCTQAQVCSSAAQGKAATAQVQRWKWGNCSTQDSARRIPCFIAPSLGLISVPIHLMRACVPLYTAFPLHHHRLAHWSLDFVGGFATRQFSVAIHRRLQGVRQNPGVIAIEWGAFYLNSSGRMAASGCYTGLASFAEEEEARAGDEQDADDAADDNAGDSAAGEPFAGC
jgi:hypothetical protein